MCAVAVIAAAASGGGAVASAAPHTARPAEINVEFCRDPPPVQMGSQMLMTRIDPGPATPMTGPYGQYGYAGYQQVIYDPGCASSALDKLKEALPPALKTGVALARPGTGSSEVAGRWITAALFVTACTVGLIRFAFGEHPVWRALDPATETIRGLIGVDLFAAWLCVSIIAMGAFIAAKRTLRLTRAVEYVARAAAIIAVALGALTWTGQVGPALDKGIAAAYTYATNVPGDSAPPDAGSVVGDAVVSRIIAPIWAEQHLGYDPEVNATFGPAFQATMAFSRADDARFTDPDLRAERAKALQDGFRSVAGKFRDDHPDLYPRLATSDSNDRGMLGFIAFLGALNVVVVVGFLTVIVAGFRLAVRVLSNMCAAIALVTVYPALQGIAFGLLGFLGRWAFASAAATGAFVAFMQAFVVGVAANPAVTVGTRVTAMSCVTAVIVAAVICRRRIAGWLRIDRDIDRAKQYATSRYEQFQKRLGHDKPVAPKKYGSEMTLRPDPARRERMVARKEAGDVAVEAVIARQKETAARARDVRRRASGLGPVPASTNRRLRLSDAVRAENRAVARAAAMPIPVKKRTGTVAAAATKTAATAMKIPVPSIVKVVK